ncbi:MAG: hypothetical protein R3230_01585 [Nitrosopumilaceae archaeon]|nr:hypothetical protein [Nitrosopumilaceae archaeon]
MSFFTDQRFIELKDKIKELTGAAAAAFDEEDGIPTLRLLEKPCMKSKKRMTCTFHSKKLQWTIKPHKLELNDEDVMEIEDLFVNYNLHQKGSIKWK